MLKPAVRVVLLFLGLNCLSAYAADDYLLTLRIERNDVLVVDTVVDVGQGSNADLRVTANSKNSADNSVPANPDEEASIRIVAGVKNTGDPEGDVEVALQYLEKKNGDWVLIAEPAIVAAIGQDASIDSTSAGSEHLKISVRIEKAVESTSPNESAQPALSESGCKDNAGLLGASPKCCSTKAMTCCNVKRCCDNRPGHGDCCDTKRLPQVSSK